MDNDELLATEVAFLNRNRNRLIRKYDSLFLLIKGTEVVDSFENETDAITEGMRKFGQEPFFGSAPAGQDTDIFQSCIVTWPYVDAFPLFSGRLEIPGFSNFDVPQGLMGVNLHGTKMDIIALIGRDLLGAAILIYNGMDGHFSVSI